MKVASNSPLDITTARKMRNWGWIQLASVYITHVVATSRITRTHTPPEPKRNSVRIRCFIKSGMRFTASERFRLWGDAACTKNEITSLNPARRNILALRPDAARALNEHTCICGPSHAHTCTPAPCFSQSGPHTLQVKLQRSASHCSSMPEKIGEERIARRRRKEENDKRDCYLNSRASTACMNIHFERDKKTNRWAEGGRARILCIRTSNDITIKSSCGPLLVCVVDMERKRERWKGREKASERALRGSLTWARLCCSRLQEIHLQNT